MTDPVLIDWTTVALSWLYGWGALATFGFARAHNPETSAWKIMVTSTLWPAAIPIAFFAALMEGGWCGHE